MFKIYGTELNQRRQELLLAIAGPQRLRMGGAEGFTEREITFTRRLVAFTRQYHRRRHQRDSAQHYC